MLKIIKDLEGKNINLRVGLKCGTSHQGTVVKVDNGLVAINVGGPHMHLVHFEFGQISYITQLF